MAELLPNWLQENCYPAQYDRLMLANVVCGEGVADGLLVTTGGSDLDLDVSQGGGWVEGDDDDRGMYSIYNDATVTLTATAANPTNPRIDQVIARVYDSTYGEGADEWVLEMLDGTPTGGATLSNLNGAASLPDNSIRLAYVLVPATFTGPFVNATHILDARTEFESCGQSNAVWQEYTPTWAGVGALDAASESRWIRNGDMVTVQFYSRFDVGGAGTISMTLPVAAANVLAITSMGVATFRNAATGGRSHYTVDLASATTVNFWFWEDDNPAAFGPTAVDDAFFGTFTYEAA